MAVLSVSTDFNTISNCDADDWSAGALNEDVQREGTGCLELKVSQALTTITYDLVTPQDYSDEHLFVYMMVLAPAKLDTKANGGMQIVVMDTLSYWGSWYVGGKDTYAGGWECFVAYTGRAFDKTSDGTVDLSAIRYIGVAYDCPLKTKGPTANCLWDVLKRGSGLFIEDGDPASPGDLDDIFTIDDSAALGVITRSEETYFLQGKLTFGSTISNSLHFQDSGKVVVFKDRPVSDDLYEIIVRGNTTVVTSFQLGEEVGGVGINGLILNQAGTLINYFVRVQDIDVDTFNIYGSVFQDANTLDVGANTIGSFQNVTFNACAEIQGGTAIWDGCQFINAPEAAFHMKTDTGMGTCSFFANSIAVSFAGVPAGSTFNLDELTFTGNDFDLFWDGASGTLTVINVDSNAITQKCPNGGTIDIQTGVWLKVYTDDEAGNPLDNVRCAIFTDPGMVQLMNELSSGGLAQESYNYQGDQAVSVRARKQGYVPIYQEVTITSVGLTVYITMAVDEAYAPT